MKKKKGFTLIELLAIIVILAIIAVITVPIILNIIDDSRKGSAIDSAYGYKKAIDQYYVSRMMADSNYQVVDDEYEISIYKSDGLTVSGEEPTDGWVKIEQGTVTDFSFLIGEYVVTYDAEANSIEAVKGTEPVLTPKMQIKKDTKEKVDAYVKAALASNSSISGETVKTVAEMSGVTTNAPDSGWIHFNIDNNSVVIVDYSLTYGDITANYLSLTNGNYVSTFGASRSKPAIIAVGSPICYGPTGSQECFKVIKVFTQGGIQKVMLFADYNLKKDTTTNPVTYKQDADSPDYISFSSSNYWINNNALVSTYSNNGAYRYDSTNNLFVDTNNTQVYPNIYDSNSNTYDYVEGYLTTLKTATYGLPSSATGRLLYYDEANDTSIFANDSARANGKNYWLGSVHNNERVMYVWEVGQLDLIGFWDNSVVRPVIIIPTSDL